MILFSRMSKRAEDIHLNRGHGMRKDIFNIISVLPQSVSRNKYINMFLLNFQCSNVL